MKQDHDSRTSKGDVKFSPATWILLGSAIVFSILIYSFINENIFKPGFQPLPADETPAAPTLPASDVTPAEPSEMKAPPESRAPQHQLDLSLDQVIGFDDPPAFPQPTPEVDDELFDILSGKHAAANHNADSRVHLGGRVLMDENVQGSQPSLRDIDGAEVDIRIDIP